MKVLLLLLLSILIIQSEILEDQGRKIYEETFNRKSEADKSSDKRYNLKSLSFNISDTFDWTINRKYPSGLSSTYQIVKNNNVVTITVHNSNISSLWTDVNGLVAVNAIPDEYRPISYIYTPIYVYISGANINARFDISQLMISVSGDLNVVHSFTMSGAEYLIMGFSVSWITFT